MLLFILSCFRLYEELKMQYEQEKLKLKENIESQNKIIEELQKKISHQLREKDELENRIKHLEKQIKWFFISYNYFRINW